jgi:hypothetical protein
LKEGTKECRKEQRNAGRMEEYWREIEENMKPGCRKIQGRNT